MSSVFRMVNNPVIEQIELTFKLILTDKVVETVHDITFIRPEASSQVLRAGREKLYRDISGKAALN